MNANRIVVAGVLLAALTAGMVGIAWASASPSVPRETTFKAIEPYDQATETDVDLGDPGFSVADQSTFRYEVYDTTGTVHLGFETSQCVVTSIVGGIFTFQCQTNFVFAGGQITSTGMLSGSVGRGPRAMIGSGGDFVPLFRFAITGGTAAYEGARGQLEWQGGPDAVWLDFEFID
jgi:hypothetical protein